MIGKVRPTWWGVWRSRGLGPCSDFASQCGVTSDQSILEKSLMRLVIRPFVSYEVKVSFKGITNGPVLINQGIYTSSLIMLIKNHLV